MWFFERKYAKNSSRTRDEVQVLDILVKEYRRVNDACKGADTRNRIQEFEDKENRVKSRPLMGLALILSISKTLAAVAGELECQPEWPDHAYGKNRVQ